MKKSNLAYNDHNYSYGYALPDEHNHSNIRIKKGKKTKGKVKTKKEIIAKRRAAKRAKRRNALFTFAVIAAAFFVLCRGVVITEKYNSLDAKKKQLEEIVSKNQKLQMEIDSSLNLNNIEDIAVNKLQMARPEKFQTVYISIKQEEQVEKTDSFIKAPKLFTDILKQIKSYLT